MKVSYQTQGTCSRLIHLEIDGQGIIRDLRFEGGCPGNLRAVELLSVGRGAREIQSLLAGVVCGANGNSCPDQLSRAIGRALESINGEENENSV